MPYHMRNCRLIVNDLVCLGTVPYRDMGCYKDDDSIKLFTERIMEKKGPKTWEKYNEFLPDLICK